jgi:Zn finger protein HypA/HybF involved in hydrogenase expression
MVKIMGKHIAYKKKCRFCHEYFMVTHSGKTLCSKCHAIHYNLETEKKVQII